MRGGCETVTKANNRKHNPRTAKMPSVEPFSVGKTDEEQNQSEGVACRRQPQSVLPYTAHWNVVRCCESHTVHCHQSEKLKYLALTLSVACFFKFFEHREIVCEYHPKRIQPKWAKSSSQKVSFSRLHATSHASSMHPCTKVPRRPRPAPFCE